ncbi:hypothetical protein [Tolypothrix sp. VBCCA 56010]
MLKAIEEVKRSHQPWDTLTHDEALRLLMFFTHQPAFSCLVS